MVIINLRPVGWCETTPRQWATIRDMIQLVRECAIRSGDLSLLMRTKCFLTLTEGRDV